MQVSTEAAVPDSRTSVKRLYAEYYIRRKGPKVYEVTKFVNGSDAPLAYYTLRETPQGILCDCQGPRYACKHRWVIPEFKRLEMENGLEVYPCSWLE